jgi:phosphatidylserine/phosphatidylglycerophosphate/cardiolipin synthase-like enzyme
MNEHRDTCATVDGNRLTLITEGPDRLTALLGLIDGAHETVRLLYYIYAQDLSGTQVYEAMERALDRGVQVSLLVDGFGLKAAEGFFNPLIAKGLVFCKFHPTFGRRYLIRNHQKMAMADGRAVLTGGFNVEDSYFGTIEEGAWRDLGLLVEGPAAGPGRKQSQPVPVDLEALFRRWRSSWHRFASGWAKSGWQGGEKRDFIDSSAARPYLAGFPSCLF